MAAPMAVVRVDWRVVHLVVPSAAHSAVWRVACSAEQLVV